MHFPKQYIQPRVSERQSRTMKEIFNSICNARISIFRAYKGFFLVNHRHSQRQGVKMAEINCVSSESITEYVCLKYDKFNCNRRLVQLQYLKTLLVGRNLEKLLCVFNMIKRNKL